MRVEHVFSISLRVTASILIWKKEKQKMLLNMRIKIVENVNENKTKQRKNGKNENKNNKNPIFNGMKLLFILFVWSIISFSIHFYNEFSNAKISNLIK